MFSITNKSKRDSLTEIRYWQNEFVTTLAGYTDIGSQLYSDSFRHQELRDTQATAGEWADRWGRASHKAVSRGHGEKTATNSRVEIHVRYFDTAVYFTYLSKFSWYHFPCTSLIRYLNCLRISLFALVREL